MGLLGKKKEIGPDTIIQRRNDLLFNEIDGEVVMLSVENGEYYGMDKTGSYIWKLLKDPMKFSELINTLICKFDVSNEQCTSDLLSFLNIMSEKNLIVYKENLNFLG